MTLLRCSAFALAFTLVLSIRLPAEACSPAPMTRFRHFPEGMVIPGNLVFFRVNLPGGDEGVARLRTAQGRRIAAGFRKIGPDLVFAPKRPIPPGTRVELYYEMRGHPLTFSFEVGPPARVALTPGNLTLLAHELKQEGATPVRESYTFSYDDGDASRALRHLTDHHAEIDGQTLTPDHEGHYVVTTSCQYNEVFVDTCGYNRGVATGQHELELTSNVVGYGHTAPVKARFAITCDPAAAAVDISRPPPPRPATELHAGSPRGCSVRAGGAGALASALPVACVCLALRRRRTRRGDRKMVRSPCVRHGR